MLAWAGSAAQGVRRTSFAICSPVGLNGLSRIFSIEPKLWVYPLVQKLAQKIRNFDPQKIVYCSPLN